MKNWIASFVRGNSTHCVFIGALVWIVLILRTEHWGKPLAPDILNACGALGFWYWIVTGMVSVAKWSSSRNASSPGDPEPKPQKPAHEFFCDLCDTLKPSSEHSASFVYIQDTSHPVELCGTCVKRAISASLVQHEKSANEEEFKRERLE